MLLDSGTVEICDLLNETTNACMPKEILKPVLTQLYGEKAIGINRAYLAKGVDEQVDMVIEIWDEGTRPKIGQYAVLVENNEQYQITLVQPAKNDDGLKIFDLTLRRLEDYYDLN